MDKALKHGETVIVDRCCVHPKERKMWITEAKKYTTTIDCIFLNTPKG
jgi:predicted kinase